MGRLPVAKPEIWVEVALVNGHMMRGMLVRRDRKSVELRFAHWVWTAQPRRITEWAEVEQLGDTITVDAAHVILVADIKYDTGQQWDIVMWPKQRAEKHRVQNVRYSATDKGALSRINPPRHPSMTTEVLASFRMDGD